MRPMKQYAQMSDEIEGVDDELKSVLAEVRKDLSALDVTQGAMSIEQKNVVLKQVKEKLDKAKISYNKLKVEMREISREQMAEYEPRLRSHNAAIDELSRMLVSAKQAADKAALMGDKAGIPTGNNLDGKDAKQILKEAGDIQGQDIKALARMQRMVEDSESVGLETNVKLRVQTEQLKNIKVDVDTVESNMHKADKLLRGLGRAMMTDKLIMCLILVMIIGIIVILVVKALGLDNNGSSATGAQVYVIDCNLNILKTNKECMEMQKKQEALNPDALNPDASTSP